MKTDWAINELQRKRLAEIFALEKAGKITGEEAIIRKELVEMAYYDGMIEGLRRARIILFND